jgi:hypothetical protein
MRRRSLLATTLILALGCDKARELAGESKGAQAAEPPAADRLDLSTHPEILFKIYGERDDPRMIPVGVMRGGSLESIMLGASGWRQFDAMYDKVGTSYAVYENGRTIGSAKVRQGMWEAGHEPLYTLPSCQLLTPQAAVTLAGGVAPGYTVSLFASTRALRNAPASTMSSAEAMRVAKGLAANVARTAGISESELNALDMHASAIASGVSDAPTIVATFVDRRSDEQSSAGERTSHIMLIADKAPGASEYRTTYSHVLNGDAASGEFRRYVDHLDVAGDGVTEIVLEGWKYGGDTFLSFLQYKSGAWTEIYRSRSSWCLDDGAH